MSQEFRVGHGLDLHRLEIKEGENFVTLGGVKIEHYKSIIAHSDGDVLIHALVDALLGSIAMGDIGTYFPPSDEKWKNANSAIFLSHVVNLLEEKNARIFNIDATIICEKPKLLPYRNKIVENLGRMLKIDVSRINLKGKTNEKLGYLGREEAIGAEVVCLIKLG